MCKKYVIYFDLMEPPTSEFPIIGTSKCYFDDESELAKAINI
jgi:hypothetical protein